MSLTQWMGDRVINGGRKGLSEGETEGHSEGKFMYTKKGKALEGGMMRHQERENPGGGDYLREKMEPGCLIDDRQDDEEKLSAQEELPRQGRQSGGGG